MPGGGFLLRYRLDRQPTGGGDVRFLLRHAGKGGHDDDECRFITGDTEWCGSSVVVFERCGEGGHDGARIVGRQLRPFGVKSRLRRGTVSCPLKFSSVDLGLHIHKVIAEAAGNAPLLQLTSQIYQQLQLALWLEVLWVDFGGTDLAEHKAIAEAIVARDPAAAAAAARAHVRSSIRNMTKVQEMVEHRRGLWSAAPSARTGGSR